MEPTTVRLDDTTLAAVRRIANREYHGDDQRRRAVRNGLTELLHQTAVERYRAGEIGTRGVAATTSRSISEAMQVLNDRGVTWNFDGEELADDVAALR